MSISDRFRRLEPLLDRALDLEGAEREAFIALCQQIHPDLVDDLRRALATDDTALPALGGLAEEVTRERPTDRRGLKAGPWRLREKLGRGGMGTVYLAERDDGAFDKRVAVKLLRGSDLRFKEQLERERQMLARLEHPGIARLLDGGVMPDGQPYLVMELAEGEDLDDWLIRAKPSLRERLRVFMAVCDAVSDAHGHLIVHRDLKPSNIRVGPNGEVKLLDFGIAKLLAGDGANRGDTRGLALTPEFAAPEQLQGRPITTRTDVYALGALLYLMLTGRPPNAGFDGNWAGFVQRVIDEDPLPPSRAEGDQLPATSLRGDLDAIAQQALQRDPSRRYGNVDALSDDVRRHLDGRPVRAHPPGLRYRSGKWLLRNRFAAALVGGVFLAVLAGVAGIVWQARITSAERDAAQVEARRYEAVLDYLLLMFREATEESGDARRLDAREMLDRGAGRVEDSFSGDRAAGDLVLATLGEIYIYLSDFSGAETLLRRFVENDDGTGPPALRARVRADLALAELRLGNVDAGCAHVEEAMRLFESDGSDQRDAMASALHVYGLCLRLSGRSAESVAAYERAAALRYQVSGRETRATATAENNLALAYYMAGRNDEALLRFERALEIFREVGAGRSGHAASTLNNLAALSFQRGDLVKSEAFYRQALEIHRESTGESAALGALLNNYGKLLTLLGQLDRAAILLEESLQLQARFVGDGSPDYAFSLLSLGDLHRARGDNEAATGALAEALRLLEARLGPDHLFSARARIAFAYHQLRIRDSEDGAIAYAHGLSQLAAISGGQASALRESALCQRAAVRMQRGAWTLAGEDLAECVPAVQRRLAASHYERVEAEALAALLARHQREPGADARLTTLLAEAERQLGPDSPRMRRLRELAG